MKLKELRIKNKLTQDDISKIINTNRQNISRYENGEVEPNINTLIKLADYYNVSLDYLCGRVWHNQIGYIPDDKKDLVNLTLKLNEANTIMAIGYVSGLLANQN